MSSNILFPNLVEENSEIIITFEYNDDKLNLPNIPNEIINPYNISIPKTKKAYISKKIQKGGIFP